MNRKITSIIFTSFFSALLFTSAYSQETEYTEVLYRVNAGGYLIDETTPDWQNDDFDNPSPFLSTTDTEVYRDVTTNITTDASVPAGVPDSLFYYERNLGTSTEDSLQWDFPVEAGRELKINLFFSEIFHDAVGERIFDIAIDHVVVLNDYDIYAEVGNYVGVMQSYTIISDGNVDIDLIREIERPKISAIEVLAIPEVVTGNQVAAAAKFSLSPNPVKDKLNITGNKAEQTSFRLISLTGQEQAITFSGTSDGYSANVSGLEKGIYLLYIDSADKREVLRFIKE